MRTRLGGTPTAWSFILPAVVVILGLSIVPVAWSFLLSMQSSDLVTPAVWVGLDNYRALVKDPNFAGAVVHTLTYTALFVPLSIGGGLALALLLNRQTRFINVYRTLVYAPFVISAAAQGVLFSFIFDSEFGLANALLHKLGISSQGFFTDPGQALYLLVVIGLWAGLGFCVIVFLAALQDIPAEVLEAAWIDGASRWSTFASVIFPLLRPVLIFLLVWETLQALQVFDIVFVTTQGGPLQSTTVVVYFVWYQAFQLFEAGYGAAAAYVVAISLLVLSVGVALLRRRSAEREDAA